MVIMLCLHLHPFVSSLCCLLLFLRGCRTGSSLQPVMLVMCSLHLVTLFFCWVMFGWESGHAASSFCTIFCLCRQSAQTGVLWVIYSVLQSGFCIYFPSQFIYVNGLFMFIQYVKFVIFILWVGSDISMWIRISCSKCCCFSIFQFCAVYPLICNLFIYILLK